MATIRIFQTCTEVRRPLGLVMLPALAHPEAPLIRHATEHGVPIPLPRGMEKEDKEANIWIFQTCT